MNRATWVLTIAICASLLLGCAEEREAPKTGEMRAEAERLVSCLAREDFAAAAKNFCPVMRKSLPPQKLAEGWRSTLATTGAFKRQVGLRTTKLKQLDAVFVTCQFVMGRRDIKVVFDRKGQVTGLWFVASPRYTPPAYVRQDAFRDEDVTVGRGEWALPGSLSLPLGAGPFPAVVLVHGSGPHDRDETIGPNKPFRDLAWGLASRRIAVLRYEKRTKAHPKVAATRAFTVKQETVDDALAAVALLRETERIDPARIFVVGHSLGAMLAPRIGLRDPNIAGFVLLAGATRPLEDILLEQAKYLLSLTDTLSDEVREKVEEIEAQVARVKAPSLSPATPASELPLGVPAPYWLDLRGYKPADAAKRLKQPMLILQGERDYQVTKADFDGWKAALSARRNVTLKAYPTLNHLFIEGQGPATPAEYEEPGHVAPAVVDDIAAWILKQAH